jgi:hypothetical protein
VKEKFPTGKQTNKSGTGTSASNVLLNIIIIVLAGLIIFMSYSLVTKIKGFASADEEELKDLPAAIVQLEVLNGCGVTGIADKFTTYLRRNNFDVVQVGNYSSFDIDNTIVVDRTGNKANAEKVAEALGVETKNIIQQINNDYFLDVSLIIGRDFNRLKPLN